MTLECSRRTRSATRSAQLHAIPPIAGWWRWNRQQKPSGRGFSPLRQLTDVATNAREHGLPTHKDGARRLKASIKSGVPVRDYCAGYDPVWIDLTKGLGCFASAVLGGLSSIYQRCLILKQQWGGGLRQLGYIAATGLQALDHHVDRLAKDHELSP